MRGERGTNCGRGKSKEAWERGAGRGVGGCGRGRSAGAGWRGRKGEGEGRGRAERGERNGRRRRRRGEERRAARASEGLSIMGVRARACPTAACAPPSPSSPRRILRNVAQASGLSASVYRRPESESSESLVSLRLPARCTQQAGTRRRRLSPPSHLSLRPIIPAPQFIHTRPPILPFLLPR